VKFLAPSVDVMIVVGSPNSSNSNRLPRSRDTPRRASYMVDRADELKANGSPANAVSA